MTKDEITEKAQELTIKNVTDGKSKYYSWGFYKGCVVGLEYNNKRITALEAQIEKMKCCSNCDNWNWKHNKCEKKLKGDCFKYSKWVMRNF